MGFAGYYHTFIPQYSAFTNKLNGIKKAENFLWNEEIGGDLVELKRAFTKRGIQAFPNFGIGDLFIYTLTGARSPVPGSGRTGEIPHMLGKKV